MDEKNPKEIIPNHPVQSAVDSGYIAKKLIEATSGIKSVGTGLKAAMDQEFSKRITSPEIPTPHNIESDIYSFNSKRQKERFEEQAKQIQQSLAEREAQRLQEVERSEIQTQALQDLQDGASLQSNIAKQSLTITRTTLVVSFLALIGTAMPYIIQLTNWFVSELSHQ